MAKMRVFELARELNIPGKDLITRIKTMGIAVDGNFNVLDEDTIGQIKAKMLEPVSRVEEKEAAPMEGAEGEEEEQPRRRRIISARRSARASKIQESMGVSGPLPEDQATRSQVKAADGDGKMQISAEAAQEQPATEAPDAEAVSADADAAVESEAPPAPVETEETAPQVAAGIAEAIKEDEAAPSRRRPTGDKERVRWRERMDPDQVPDDDRFLEANPNMWREAQSTASQPDAPQPDAPQPDAPQPDAPQPEALQPEKSRPAAPRHNYNKEWVRPTRSRRGGERRGGRAAKRSFTQDSDQKHTFGPRKRQIRIGQQITVSNLAGALGVKANEIIKKLIALGVMATINQPIDGATAELIAAEFNIEIAADTTDLEDLVKEEAVDPAALRTRPPIVTIMGHVDHGKTSLLDHIRSSHITDKETGGITQHIGAYHVRSEYGDIVFLDTPGHEAFTTLRARGADITDLVVLVVAADDGVMPQTVEAIDHARAAQVPILVAINKMDRNGADPDKIKRQLMEHDLLAEEFGGDTVIVPVSAVTGEGVPQLLEMIHLQAEIMELKAPFEGKARGYVIETKMDRRRGPVATVIVQRGTLAVGDDFVAGTTTGRVRAVFDDMGVPVERATPSIPVELLGYSELPQAGDVFVVMDDDRTARQVADMRLSKQQEIDSGQQRRMHLEDFIQGVSQEEMTILNLVLKADTQGSLEALRGSLDRQGNATAKVEIIRAGIGGISETDVSLAATTNAVVVGFNVRADSKAEQTAQQERLEIKLYTVIYDLINEVRDALQGLLKPIIREEIIGHGEVRETFSMSKEGQVAGSYIKDGRLERNSLVRLFRDDVLIHSGTIDSLRRFKDDVQNVQAGYECGLRISNCKDIRVGDLIEAYVHVEEMPVLEEGGQR
ncbi:MAG: translation initiation factor IF-2 [SAR324 cluster bacterium]|nr:translation initiation factor IF-2 [SAR324 cluster bacterium]